MISEEKRQSNKEKRDSLFKALEVIAEKEPAYSKIAAVVDELAKSKSENERFKNLFYSFSSDRSTPTDNLAQRIYNRWPYPDVFDVLAGKFAVQRAEPEEEAPDVAILRSIPDLVADIRRYRALNKDQEKIIEKLKKQNTRLKKAVRSLPPETNESVKNAHVMLDLENEDNAGNEAIDDDKDVLVEE